ncbi:MAG TPA: ABC transporter substrate-binding protein [Xanthobacteraceae bacterium]|jgi:NitT/TauT family transport system substrate-binding protein
MKWYLAALAISTLLIGGCAHAANKTHVNFIMDWAFEGAQAIWPAAAESGCFADNNLDVKIDRSFGSGDALGKVASGAYDIGVADFSSLINYDAAHPDDKIAAVFVISERSPMSIVTLKKYNITKPQDLAGKRIADQQGEASRVMFPAFAKANGIDPSSITWVSVAPNLRQPILIKGDADAAAGHRFTILVGLRALGVRDDEVTLFPYADWGVRAFGNSVVVKKKWAAAHPEAMRSFLNCTATAIKLSIANPEQAISWLKKYNSLIDEKFELQGLDFSNNLAIITPETKKNGLSTFSKQRLDEILTQVSDALQVKKPAADDIWDPDYLPPASELELQ